MSRAVRARRGVNAVEDDHTSGRSGDAGKGKDSHKSFMQSKPTNLWKSRDSVGSPLRDRAMQIRVICPVGSTWSRLPAIASPARRAHE